MTTACIPTSLLQLQDFLYPLYLLTSRLFYSESLSAIASSREVTLSDATWAALTSPSSVSASVTSGKVVVPYPSQSPGATPRCRYHCQRKGSNEPVSVPSRHVLSCCSGGTHLSVRKSLRADEPSLEPSELAVDRFDFEQDLLELLELIGRGEREGSGVVFGFGSSDDGVEGSSSVSAEGAVLAAGRSSDLLELLDGSSLLDVERGGSLLNLGDGGGKASKVEIGAEVEGCVDVGDPEEGGMRRRETDGQIETHPKNREEEGATHLSL